MERTKNNANDTKANGKTIIKNGFVRITQNGSHLKLFNKTNQKTVIVSLHNKDLGIGLEQSILKQVGLK
jgi:predicted RNA binding protein YcfA (HicA-like mRNA interferase family)